MILIVIFISLITTYYLTGYFERSRDERNNALHEKRREAYTTLLNSLKEKENAEAKTENPDII